MLLRRNSWVARGSFAVLAASALALSIVSQRATAAAPDPSASSRPDPRSCKVMPDVGVRLEPAGVPGAWRLHLDALAKASDVVVSIGTTDAGRQSAPRVVWRGALAQGEVRDVEVHLAVATSATEVWAQASVAGRAGTIQQGRATLALQDGKAVARAASAPAAGRLVRDAQSGQTVIELPGTVGGGR